mmetsp:Transcript_14431/g.25844  ORF Transcript_14431/g.25844 Transcript_14431/m.25844 type:complete len:325 (-) Transcript_14431:46-1020(-)
MSDNVVLAGLVAVWYGSSMLSATSSKTLLVGGSLAGLQADAPGLTALELTGIQMLCASLLAMVTSILSHRGGVRQLIPASVDAFIRTVSLACVFSVGFITLNLAYTLMSTSLANTLRAMEPICSLFLAWVTTKQRIPLQLIFAVAVIVCGACLASYGNAEFTLMGLLFCTIANFAFAYRTIQYKEIRRRYAIDHATLFFQTCLFSSVVLFGSVVAWEPTARAHYVASLYHSGSALFFQNVASNGVTFFLYLQLSFATLSYITVVTHAILNSVRRPAVILFDVLVFKTQLSPINQGGIAMACIGVTLYSVLKARLASASPGTKIE